MSKLLLPLLLIQSYTLMAQESPLSAFDHLVGKTWMADGKWGDGSLFKQETTFEYALGNTIVIAKSKGFTDTKQTTYGDRNFGIRAVDANTGQIIFTEYDVFGGITEGQVISEGNQLIYQYQYGESNLADIWEMVDDSTYSFTVCTYENNQPGQAYLVTQFKLIKSFTDR